MDTLKIKIEIGDRKFDADGPVDVVNTHANAFMKLTLGGNAETIAVEAELMAKAEAEAQIKARSEQQSAQDILQLDSILRVEGANVALCIRPQAPEDALLAQMLGHRNLRKHSLISAKDLADGLRASGIKINRADHLLKTCLRWKYVSSIGRYRARRWQLTDAGIERAESVARVLIEARAKQQNMTRSSLTSAQA